MEDFTFALNATLPVFLIILLGWFLRRIRLLNENFCNTANQYVFKCSLPISLFLSIVKMDFYADFDAGFCLFCVGVTTVMFLGVWGVTRLLMKDRTQIGAFSQAAVRSSAALLGVALAVNIYGNEGMVPMMIMSAVPLFNAYAVLILTFSPPAHAVPGTDAPSRGASVRKAVKAVITNPLIIGVVLGLPFTLLRIQLPKILLSTLNTVGGTASPIGLLVIGAGFSGAEAIRKWKPAAAASAVKLFLLPLLFIPLAALLGFRDSQLVAVLIMVGSPTTFACYVMAKGMYADETLTSNTVVLTTLLSSVSITLFLYLLRTFSLI